MKPGILLALIFFASAAHLAAADVYQPATIAPPAPPREFRGAWIATVANKDWPSAPGLSVAQQKAELISLLDTAVRLKLNAVIFQVRPSCDVMYASTMEPWSYYLTGTPGEAPQPYYDPLAFAIQEAHRRGLELHAWFNPFRARMTPSQPLAMNHVARTHPEWVCHYADQLWLDPGVPAVRDYVLRVIMDVVRRYDIDGVQFDDYFYPYPVKNSSGINIVFPDNTSWRTYGVRSGMSRDDWRRPKHQRVSSKAFTKASKASKSWVKFGISPFGIWRPGYPPSVKGSDAYAELYADSRLWLANGWVDYLSPQLYWPIDSPQHSFSVLLNWWAQQNVRQRNLWPGLAAYQAGTLFPPAEIGRQIQVTRAQPGASGVILFHLKSFEENPVLASVVAAQYTQPAMVPPSPWLDSVPPAKPQLAARENGADWTFQWASPGGNPVARWLLQYYTPEHAWQMAVLPPNQWEQTFGLSPEAVSIRSIDRAGNLGPPTVVRKAGGASVGTAAPPLHTPEKFLGVTTSTRGRTIEEIPLLLKRRRFWKGCKPNSVPLFNGENHLSAQPIPETRPLSRNWSGPLRGFLFGLAPDGVFRAASLTLRAVRSYRTFSPSPQFAPGLSIFCGTVRREFYLPPACIAPEV